MTIWTICLMMFDEDLSVGGWHTCGMTGLFLELDVDVWLAPGVPPRLWKLG